MTMDFGLGRSECTRDPGGVFGIQEDRLLSFRLDEGIHNYLAKNTGLQIQIFSFLFI